MDNEEFIRRQAALDAALTVLQSAYHSTDDVEIDVTDEYVTLRVPHPAIVPRARLRLVA